MAASDTPRSDPPPAPEPVPESTPEPARSGNAFPIAAALIVLGVLLLALNLNLLRWSALLAVLSLWPLALVALGVDLITRGRFRVPIWIAVAAIAVLASFGRLGPLTGVVGPTPALGGSGTVAEQTRVAVPRDGARTLDLDLSTGVAELRLDALARGGGAALEGTINTARDQRLEQRVERDGATLRASFRTESEDRFGVFGQIRTSGDDRTWQLSVDPDVALELSVDTGVGRSDLDLRELQLAGFDVNAGVGEVIVTLPAHGGYRGSIDAGVGEIVVRVPQGAAVRIDVDRGLGSLELRGFEQVGDGYQTAAYATASAADRADIAIDGGLGTIALRAD